MNLFVTLEEFSVYNIVTYYTVKIEEEDLTETEKFLDRYYGNILYKEDYDYIVNFLQELGDTRGAQKKYFRFENSGDALPPSWIENELRLYCIRLTDEIVILGNGGLKTSDTAQGSPDCKPKFDLINKIGRELDRCLGRGEITILDNKLYGDLEFYINI